MGNELRVVPIHRSLVRPQLLMGCERLLFLMLTMVVTLLIMPGGIIAGSMFNIILGILLFIFGRMFLVYMAKLDPQMSEIFQRSVIYRSFYPAVSTVGWTIQIDAKRW